MVEDLEQKINRKGEEILNGFKSKIRKKLEPHRDFIIATGRASRVIEYGAFGALMYNACENRNYLVIGALGAYFGFRILGEYLDSKK
ncbi:MAG: hypothetical protein AABX17_00735 [Nanoarchaeota archaeon]